MGAALAYTVLHVFDHIRQVENPYYVTMSKVHVIAQLGYIDICRTGWQVQNKQQEHLRVWAKDIRSRPQSSIACTVPCRQYSVH